MAKLPSKKGKLASILKKKMDEVTTASVSPTDQVQKEIEYNLSAPDLDAECNPLLWWKVKGCSVPNLIQVS